MTQQEPARTAPEPREPPSLIETMRVEPGRLIPLLELHLERLYRSCTALGYEWPGVSVIRNRVTQSVVLLNKDRSWRLRLLLAPDGALSVEHGPLEPPHGPLPVILSGPRLGGASDWLRHKTTYRPWYEEASAWLQAHPQVFDILYWNENEEMCEGSRSNVYIQRPDGSWLTPPLAAGVLPGVQRQALLQAGLAYETAISREAFLNARARRISNALRGWRDIRLHQTTDALG